MEFITLTQRIFIVKKFYQSGSSTDNVQKEFAEKFHELESPSANSIIKLVSTFELYGNVMINIKREILNNLNELQEVEHPVGAQTTIENLNENTACNSEITEIDDDSEVYVGNLQDTITEVEHSILQDQAKIKKFSSKVRLLLKCDVCDKVFNRRARYDRHMNGHKNTCQVCYKRVRNVKVHMRRHTNEKIYQCSQCGKQFQRYDRLRCHMVSHSEERPFPCETCSKAFKTRKHLQEHTKTHLSAEDRPIFCKVCGKRFLYNVDLKKHSRIHTGEKPALCVVCEKRFASNDILKIHTRIHTGEKPYQCPYCEQQFSRCGSFHSHKRIHTGEKPFKCNYCEKTFYDSGSCRAHEHVHIADYPYKCLQCEKAYNHLSSLKSHMKYTHRDAKNP